MTSKGLEMLEILKQRNDTLKIKIIKLVVEILLTKKLKK